MLLVHRPKYDDWSLPKGKRDPGETDEQCAVREVEEETGVRAVLDYELLPVRYRDDRDREKVVRYWAMTAVAAKPFVPNEEIDELAWVPLAQARDQLTRLDDWEVLANVRLPFTSGSPTAP